MSKASTYHIYTKPTCPWGKKAIALMESRQFSYEVHHLNAPEDVAEFKTTYGVLTTPQIFKDGQRIGGYSELAETLGARAEESEAPKTYRPVVAVFSVAALMAIATTADIQGFMGFSLCLLAMLKLMDLQAFGDSFRNYDLITKSFPMYGSVYPFLELLSGLGFLSGVLPLLTGGIALVVGLAGGVSVFKAVYIDKLNLNCACVGGNTKVPLGAISFTENAVMAGMGLWVLL